MTYCPLCHKSLCVREKRSLSERRGRITNRNRHHRRKHASKGPSYGPSPRKSMSSKLDRETKQSSVVVASTCGHLFHLSCITQLLNKDSRNGDGCGSTSGTYCPLCQVPMPNLKKLLRIDVGAHIGILDEFFNDVYKLNYMNEELKGNLQDEWAEIADMDCRIESRSAKCQKLCKTRNAKIEKIKADEEKINKIIEDASTCYRYREIEKQLLDENVNLQAVVRKMEAVLEARLAEESQERPITVPAVVEPEDVTGMIQSSPSCKVAEKVYDESEEEDTTISARTGVNCDFSVSKQWSLVITSSGTAENNFMDKANSVTSSKVSFEPNMESDSVNIIPMDGEQRVGTNATPEMTDSILAIRNFPPSPESTLHQLLNGSFSSTLCLKSKADDIPSSESRPSTFLKLPGETFCRVETAELKATGRTICSPGHIHAVTDTEIKLTRSVSYVVKTWGKGQRQSKVQELHDGAERKKRVKKEHTFTKAKNSLKIGNVSENGGNGKAIAKYDRGQMANMKEVGLVNHRSPSSAKVFEVSAKKSLTNMSSRIWQGFGNTSEMLKDLASGKFRQNFRIDFEALWKNVEDPCLSLRITRTAIVSAPSPRKSKGFPSCNTKSRTKSWTTILKLAEAHHNDILHLSRANLLAVEYTDSNGGDGVKELDFNLNDLIVKPPPVSSNGTIHALDSTAFIPIVPPPPPMHETPDEDLSSETRHCRKTYLPSRIHVVNHLAVPEMLFSPQMLQPKSVFEDLGLAGKGEWSTSQKFSSYNGAGDGQMVYLGSERDNFYRTDLNGSNLAPYHAEPSTVAGNDCSAASSRCIAVERFASSFAREGPSLRQRQEQERFSQGLTPARTFHLGCNEAAVSCMASNALWQHPFHNAFSMMNGCDNFRLGNNANYELAQMPVNMARFPNEGGWMTWSSFPAVLSTSATVDDPRGPVADSLDELHRNEIFFARRS